MSINSVSSVNNKSNSESVKITSLKDLESNPQFFPVWMAEIQRKNISNLLSVTNTGDGSDSSDSSVFGLSDSSGGADSFSALGAGLNASDPMAGIFSSQGMASDFSFMTPSTTLQSFQVNDTLQGLQNYTNAVEAKKWSGQLITYIDPTDKVVKEGRIAKIDVEHVKQPVFYTEDGTKLSLDDIKSLNAELSTNLQTA